MLGEIRTLLISNTAIANMVGTQVFVGFATQEVREPYIILEDILQNPNDCKDRKSVMDSYMFAVTIVATQFSDVEILLNLVRLVLDMYQDDLFKRISYEGMQELYDGTQDYHVKTNTYKSLITVV